MKIFLTGYMGSGKSTIGPLLAGRLGMDFIDLDLEIERNLGQSITDIFEQQGESFFREEEHKQLTHFIESNKPFVMACGGGTACYFGAMDKMNASGITVFLETSPEELVQRLHAKRKTRPLLKDANDAELRTLIEDAVEKRRTSYEKAKIRVSSESGVWNIVDNLVEKIKDQYKTEKQGHSR